MQEPGGRGLKSAPVNCHLYPGTIMPSPEILLLQPMRPAFEQRLANRFVCHRLWEAGDRDALLAEIGPRVSALACFGGPVNRQLLARLPALEMIATATVGYDGIDTRAVGERGIIVTNTPDVLTDEVADLALGLILATVREIPAAERHLRDGRWPSGPFRLSATLRGRTVGIFGLGRIGKAIAARLKPFGVTLAYHGRRLQADVPYTYYPTLEELAAAVDMLVIVTPGGEETRNAVDARILRALGPEGILINVARGSVVDETALIAALENGTIHSAGLDVFADEPNVPAGLVAMENAVLLPHIASASVKTRDEMAELAADNILAWADRSAPLTPIPETPWLEWR